MKTHLLTAVVAVAVAGVALADDKKFDTSKLEGKWTMTEGKKAGAAASDDSKKSTFVFTKDTVKIMEGDKAHFVMKFTIDDKVSPAAIDLEITEGIEGTKGSKAKGIIELKDGVLKLAYDPMGGDRPAKFDGEKTYYFVFKKEEKKDK